jgi:elongation factor G
MGDRESGSSGPRSIALVGPFQSGKTTLLEAILARTGAIQRQGTVDTGTTIGDASNEARHHKMSVEVTIATTTFMGDSYTFIDCPGSVEFVHEMRAALPAVDAAVVVCEADERKVAQLQLIMRELEDLKIPRLLFLNKIDKVDKQVRESLKLLQPASRRPLLLRQIPIWKNEIITGFVDLALERAFVYREHAASEVIALEGDELSTEKDARFTMLETLADHDDELMEQLLADIPPPRDRVFDDLAKELRDGLVCPVLIGVATRTNGVLRLLKALRHEVPGIAPTAKRLGVKAGGDSVATVLKTFHTTHGGKLSVVRVLNGQVGDGVTLNSPTEEAGRVSGVAKMIGLSTEKRGPAGVGETVALGKLDHARTGDTLSAGKQPHPAVAEVKPYPGVLAIAISAKERKDDVKLGLALNKLVEEDPSLTVFHNPETHEMVVWGQGEMHLRVATERLADRFGIAIERRRPTVGYRETIKKPIQQRGRHKKQSGGHGQFGDVVLDIKPLPRGAAQLHPVGRGRRDRRAQARSARVSGGRCVGGADRRLLSRGRFLRHGVPHRRPHRHRRCAAAMPAGAAGADPHGRDRLPVGRLDEDQRHPIRPARPDSRLRHPRGLGRLGRGACHDAGNRDRRSHHRGAIRDRRRRQLHLQVRPHGRTDRQARRSDRGGETRRGVRVAFLFRSHSGARA